MQSTTVSSGLTASGSIVGSGGTLVVQNGGTAIGAMVAGGTEVVSSGGAAIGTTVGSGGSEVISNGGVATGATIGAGGTLVFDGGSATGVTLVGGSLTLGPKATGAEVTAVLAALQGSGTVDLPSTLSLVLLPGSAWGREVVLNNAGKMSILSVAGQPYTSTTIATVVNNGTMTIDPTTLVIADLSGSGTIVIHHESDLAVQSAFGGGQTIDFDGKAATLTIGAAAAMPGPTDTLSGFATDDRIDLSFVSYGGTADSYTVSGDAVTVSAGGTAYTLDISGATSGSLSLGEDSDGHLEIVDTEDTTGTISSMVFLDGLADGTYHVGDPGVAGVTVKLLRGTTVVATTTTNSNGTYSFAGLAPGAYTVQVVAPSGMAFSATEHASGNPLIDSDVNPTTGLTAALAVAGGQTITGTAAGLVFDGEVAGVTPVTLGAGQAYSGNSGSGVIVGAGNDNVHTGSGGNNLVVLGGGSNVIEEGSGATTDIGTSAGALNAQTQNAADGFLFAGTGSSTLQGGQGNAYLVGGTGKNTVAGGSGDNLLVGGVGGGSVTTSGTQVTGYGTGSEVRVTGSASTILYQKGDGVQVLDGTFNPVTDLLEIYGYSGGTMETVNGQEALYLGGNDLIVFNGGNPFTNGTGSSFAGMTFNANIAAAPQYGLTFGANGLPEILPAGATVVSASTITATITATSTATSTGTGDDAAPAKGPIPVSLSAYNDALTLDSQSYDVSGSQGNATITAGNGKDTITAGGYDNRIVLGNGADTVTGPQGNATVVVGDGKDTIDLGGQGNTITAGSGTSTIVAGAGNDTVNTGAGHDTVTLSGWSNLVTVGAGAATFMGGSDNTYAVSAVGSSGGMTVDDFSFNNGDVLNLSQIMAQAGWNDLASTLGGLLKVSEVGSNTVVSIDPAGSGAGFHIVATLVGLAAGTLGTLEMHNAIVL